MLFLMFMFVCFPRAGSFQLRGASVDSGHLLGDVCRNLCRGAAASGGFYTYLALGSLQTSCREEETFPLPQDNLLSYRKRVYVSGQSIWDMEEAAPRGPRPPLAKVNAVPSFVGWHLGSDLLEDVLQVLEEHHSGHFIPSLQ